MPSSNGVNAEVNDDSFCGSEMGVNGGKDTRDKGTDSFVAVPVPFRPHGTDGQSGVS